MELLEEALEVDQAGPTEAAFRMSHHAAAVPDELYHYTTDAGLYGIMQSGHLRIVECHRAQKPRAETPEPQDRHP
jgi:hypothetical protein